MAMRKKDKPITIESKSLYKTLARVALPIALQSLIASSLSLVDSLMVGNLGETELAAVGLGSQLFFIHWGVLFGFASGSAAFMSQFFGAGDIGSTRKVTGFAVTMCFSISMVFFVPAMFFPEFVVRLFTDIPEAIILAKSYVRIASICFLTISITVPFTAALRATQQTKIPLKISIFVFSTNTILNYLFIYGKLGLPAMGVSGAALATAISRSLELMLVLYVVFGRKNLLAGKISEYFRWHKKMAMRILISAGPVTVNEAAWSIGMATYNAAYGRIGITEFAAIQASTTINQMFIMAIFSLGDALLILVGQRIGMGQLDYAFALAKRLLKIGIGVGLTSGILLIISSRFIVNLFNFTEEGQRYTILILTIYGVMMAIKLFNGLNITGVFRCGGDTWFAMFAEVGCVWLIGVPVVWISVRFLHLPVFVIVALAQSEEFVKMCLCIWRFRSKKWLKSLIAGLS